MIDTSVSDVKNYVEDKVHDPDWLASEDEDGYIKNKPLVKNIIKIGSIKNAKYEQSLNFEQPTDYKKISEIITLDQVEYDIDYVVNIDNDQYKCKGVYNSKSSFVQISNGKIDDVNGNPAQLLDPKEGEFVISFMPPQHNKGDLYIYDPNDKLSKDISHNVTIYKYGTDVIDSKYTSVDWESEENIRNKPFGKVRRVIFKQTNLNSDISNGNARATTSGGFLNFSFDINLTYTVVINDKVYDNLVPNSTGNLSNDYTGTPMPLYQNADFILYGGANSQGGSMFFKEPMVDGTVIIYANVIEKLENKYLDIFTTVPETIVYDAKVNGEDWHKLWWTYTQSGPSGNQYTKYTYSRAESISKFPSNGTYTVNIDGKKYVCKPQFKAGRMYLSNGTMNDNIYNYMNGPISIGDFFISFSEGDGSNYSFALYVICSENDKDEQLLSDFTISLNEHDNISNDLLPITQSVGTSDTQIMSQKAVTTQIDSINSNVKDINNNVDTLTTLTKNISDWNIQEFDGGIKNKPFGLIVKKASLLYQSGYFNGMRESSSKYPEMKLKTINAIVDINKYYYIKFNDTVELRKFEHIGNDYRINFGTIAEKNNVYIIKNGNNLDVYINYNFSYLNNFVIYEVTEIEERGVNSITINNNKYVGDVELDNDIQQIVGNELENELYEGPNVSNGYEFIDMGLSVKWATCNIGATKPEEYGWFFQWGGTIPYNSDRTPVTGGDPIEFNYNSNCPYWVSGDIEVRTTWSKYTKYDNKTVLELEDDAAYEHISEYCRTPTKEDYLELIDACTIKWVTNYNDSGIDGMLFTLNTDSSKTLFFPAAGILNGTDYNDANSCGHYLLSSFYVDYSAYHLKFESPTKSTIGGCNRCYGIQIRPVLGEKPRILKYIPRTEAEESYATKEDVKTAIDNLVNGADETMDTLSELAQVISDNKNVIEDLKAAGLDKASKEDLRNATTDMATQTWVTNTFETKEDVETSYQKKGDYITEEQLSGHLSNATVKIATDVICTPSTTSDISQVPTNSRMCVVNTDTGNTFGLDGSLAAGAELLVIINNTGSLGITIDIPSTYKSNGLGSISIAGGNYGEISIISDGTNLYLKAN